MELLQLGVLFIVLFVVFVLGGAYGWDLRERHAKRTLESLSKKVEETLTEEVKNVIHITVEEHNGVLFVYNKEDHNFMAQGSTAMELEKNLSERFPGKRFACSEEHMKLLRVM